MGFSFRNLIIALGAAAIAGCSLIDDDLSDCGVTFETDYELELVTNMTTELQTQLALEADIHVATALKAYLKNIFSDYAHDVDISFYGVEADSTRLKYMSEVMDASQSSYTFFIPSRKYMHLAVANLRENGMVDLTDSLLCHRSKLVQTEADTLPAHRTGLFTARLPMEVLSNEDQSFDVRLYMANCATALVIDTVGCHLHNIKAFSTGFATAFSICDSLYTFKNETVMRADLLPVEDGGQICFSSVNFPSRDTRDSKLVIETTDPFISDDAEEALWRWKVYTTLPNGTIVESAFNVMNPLRPGQLRIIKAKALENGAVQPDMSEVGVILKIDWNYGHSMDIEL